MLPQSTEKSQILSTGTHERQHIQNSTSLINHYIIQQGLIDSCLTDHIQYAMLHHSCAFQSSFSGHFMRPRKKKNNCRQICCPSSQQQRLILLYIASNWNSFSRNCTFVCHYYMFVLMQNQHILYSHKGHMRLRCS